MIQREQYVRYLLSTPTNRTCTNLADYLDGVSHDTVSDFLRQERVTARDLWRLVGGLIQDGPEACLIVDDSVQDKRYARFIELVKRQWSGAVGGLVRGIGIVNLVHSAGPKDPDSDCYPIDYRLYAPDVDGKTKNEHFREMLLRAVADKRVQARTVLFDAWYASVANLKLVQRLGLKQLTGTEQCQCRFARSQRTHLACCYHAGVSLKVQAKRLGKTLYQVRADLFREYLRAQLRQPSIPVFTAC